ncbi:MAG: hypothetical protein E4H20_04250 [Spirochaetales bacterium]|nr:MAG: hypothetical protein E4H20_04250 [Spirochaetales bacterium]
MNLHFLKLRVADDPWLLIDWTSDSGDGPDWAAVAHELCHGVRGASASGLVVVERSDAGFVASPWGRNGLPCPLEPSAALCTARWLFDTGRTNEESIAIRSRDGDYEAMVLDSRNFGLALGSMTVDGSPTALMVALAGKTVPVRLFDGGLPSRRRSGGARESTPVVEVFAIARHALRARRNGQDALAAAAAALAASSTADFAEREATVGLGPDEVLVQWPETGQVFVAAEARYCFSGDFWAEERKRD